MASTEKTSRFRGIAAAIRRRYRVFVAAAALGGLGFLGAQAWQYAQTGMRDDPRYRVTAAAIETPPTPPWIRTDIRLEALRDAGLHGDLSILDPPDQLQKRLASAFLFHPWVETVGTITKSPPNRIAIELTYRRPLAAVEIGGQQGELLAIDGHAVLLPSDELTHAELSYLPRILGIDSTTLTGEVWQDARVQGAVSLVAAFGEHWSRMQLVDIVPHRQPEIRGDLRYAVFDLVTRGGTRIVWGAAPNVNPPGEAPFAEKFSRLAEYVRDNGSLGSASFETPEVLDVRAGLNVVPRTAKAKEPRTAKVEEREDPQDEAVVK